MMTEHCDPVADMISEGGPVFPPAIIDVTNVGVASTSRLSSIGTVTPTVMEIPLGSAVVDMGEAQTRMVGEGGNPHGQC